MLPDCPANVDNRFNIRYTDGNVWYIFYKDGYCADIHYYRRWGEAPAIAIDLEQEQLTVSYKDQNGKKQTYDIPRYMGRDCDITANINEDGIFEYYYLAFPVKRH